MLHLNGDVLCLSLPNSRSFCLFWEMLALAMGHSQTALKNNSEKIGGCLILGALCSV